MNRISKYSTQTRDSVVHTIVVRTGDDASRVASIPRPTAVTTSTNCPVRAQHMD